MSSWTTIGEFIEKHELLAPVVTGIFQVVCLSMIYKLNRRADKKKDMHSMKEEVYTSAIRLLYLQKEILMKKDEVKLKQTENEEWMSINAAKISIFGSAEVYKLYDAINQIQKVLMKKRLLADETKNSDKKTDEKIVFMYMMFDKEISRLVRRMRQELDYGVDGWDKLPASRCPVCQRIVKDHEGCSECDMSYIDRILFDVTPDYKEKKLKEYKEKIKSRDLLF